MAYLVGGCTTFDDHSDEQKERWAAIARKMAFIVENPDVKIEMGLGGEEI